MSDLVGNPEDRFSRVAAHLGEPRKIIDFDVAKKKKFKICGLSHKKLIMEKILLHPLLILRTLSPRNCF